MKLRNNTKRAQKTKISTQIKYDMFIKIKYKTRNLTPKYEAKKLEDKILLADSIQMISCHADHHHTTLE